MPLEEIVRGLERERKVIIEALRRQDEMIASVTESIRHGDNDWITVQAAAARLGASQRFVYNLIDNGRLRNIRHVGGRKYVSRAEIDAIDDRPRL